MKYICVISLLFLTSCVSTGVIDLEQYDTNQIESESDVVSIIDKRYPINTTPYSEGFFITLGDQNYSPDILQYLKASFYRHKPKNLKKVHITLSDFRSSIHNNAGAAGVSIGASTIPGAVAILDNRISCYMTGLVNNNTFSVKHQLFYHMPAYAFTVFTDDKTALAIEQCIDNLTKQVYRKIR